MKKLRIYLKESDKICDNLLKLLEEKDISGVSVFKTIYSYGASKKVSSILTEVESYDMGIRIDIVDKDEKIYNIIKSLQNRGFLMVISDCEVL